MADVVLPFARLVEPPEEGEIDGLDLPGQRLALGIVQLVPEGQQMFLAVRAEDGEKLVFRHDCGFLAVLSMPILRLEDAGVKAAGNGVETSAALVKLRPSLYHYQGTFWPNKKEFEE